MNYRDFRGHKVIQWGIAAFGLTQMEDVQQRVIRFLEEAIELGQAADVDPGLIAKLIQYVYSRPKGEIEAEFGGVSVTLLALAGALRKSADELEQREVDRILAKGPEYFTARNKANNDAGFHS